MTGTKVLRYECNKDHKKEAHFQLATASYEIETSSHLKMTGTQKVINLIQQDGIEPEYSCRSKVIFNIPSTTNLDQQQRSSSEKEDAKNITSVISHVAGRFREGFILTSWVA